MGDAADDAFDQAMFEMMDEDFGYMQGPTGHDPYNDDPNYLPDKDLCPNCGAPTVLKKGPYGKFYGCSAYPKCKGSISI